MVSSIINGSPLTSVALFLILIGCLDGCYKCEAHSYTFAFALAPTVVTENHRIRRLPRAEQRQRRKAPASIVTRQRSLRNNYRGDGELSSSSLSLPAKSSFGETGESPNYLITDSLHLDDADRPTVAEFAFTVYPREAFFRLPFLACGTALSACNVLGNYDESVYAPLVISCVYLGLINAMLDATETRGVSKDVRRGSIDGRVLQIYAATYSASVCWLALRVYPPVCPNWLPALDPIAGTVTSALFVASLAVPVLTLLSDLAPENALLEESQLGLVRLVRGDPTIEKLPPFTPVERYRAVGLLVIGFVACLYLPVASYLALYGDPWWSTSLARYPEQGLLETSTALFGLIAAQSNILITRAAGVGVRPIGEMVNLGAAACLLLAVVPCASALYFLQAGTTFFDHYNYVPS